MRPHGVAVLLFTLGAACGSGDDSARGATTDADAGVGLTPIAEAGSGAVTDAGPHVDASNDAAPPPVDATPPPPDVDTLPWQSVGYGVTMKDTENPAGDSIFVGYAGYSVELGWSQAWVTALYKAELAARGVRTIFAVQGPNDPSYSNFEIGNSKLVAAMLPRVASGTKFILVAGHSSGSFVAHEMLGQLAGGLDPTNITAGRVVYFDLDGGESGLTQSIVARLRHAYFVASRDGATGTDSPNMPTMQSLGATYASAGGYWQNDASGSGCDAGAVWCVHTTLITTVPHDPTTGSPQADYSDFKGRSVTTAYIEAKAKEAGL
jgi:hypothetical protein